MQRGPPAAGSGDKLFISSGSGRKSNFESSFRDRKVVNGRRVEPTLFDEHGVMDTIEAMGWTPFVCMGLATTYPRLVRLFYCNLEFSRSEPSITSLVNGTPIRLDCDSLSSMLNVPNEGTKYYKTWSWETNDCDLSDAVRIVCGGNLNYHNHKARARARGRADLPSIRALPARNRVLLSMVSFMFLSRGGGHSRDRLTMMDLFLLKKILCRERVNLSYIIIHRMIESFLHKRATLPYGMLLTKVFNAFRVVIDVGEESRPLEVEEVYTSASLIRMGYHRTQDGWEPEEEEGGDAEGGEEEGVVMMDEMQGDLSSDLPRRSSCEGNDGIQRSLDELTARLDNLASSVESLRCQQEQGFKDMNLKLDSLMNFLNHHFWPYPPPPAPFEG